MIAGAALPLLCSARSVHTGETGATQVSKKTCPDIVRGLMIEEIACANLLFEGLGNLPPGGFQIEEGQVEQTIPGTTLGTTLVDQTPSHFK